MDSTRPTDLRSGDPAEARTSAFVLAAAFLSGAALMGIEMAGQRALSPYFGSSNLVWTSVIGVLMCFMALGYWFGGRLADRYAGPAALVTILGAAGLAAAISPVFVNYFGNACLPEGLSAEYSYRINLLGSLAASLLFLAPPVLLLSLLPPFLIKSLAWNREVSGKAAGAVNALSAIGSLAGTFSATLVLIPGIGPRASMTALAAALIALSAAGAAALCKGRMKFLPLACAPALLLPAAFSGHADRGGEETLFEAESHYQYVRVYRKDGARYLTLNEGRDQFHSLLVEGSFLTGKYFDYLSMIPLHFDPSVKPGLRVCLVGLAAGIYSRQLHHFFGEAFRLEVDGAEIDPAVLDAGRRHFGLDGPENRNLAAAAADGRLFLEASPGGYDLIAVDAYSRQLYIPFHLVTSEFFALCSRKLSPGGFVAVNVCDFGAGSPMLEAVVNTMAGIFGSACALRLPGTMNYLVYSRKGDLDPDIAVLRASLSNPALSSREGARQLEGMILPLLPYRSVRSFDPGGLVLTDDRAPADRLMDRSFRRVRSRLRW